MLLQVGIALLEERRLLAGADAATSRFAVFPIQRIDDLQSFGDATERHERFLVMGRAVVGQIDEHLRGAPVRHGKRKRDGTADVRLLEGIIWNGPGAPRLRHCGLPIDAELRPGVGPDAKDRRIVVVAGGDELIEAIGPVRRPRTNAFDADRALRRKKSF